MKYFVFNIPFAAKMYRILLNYLNKQVRSIRPMTISTNTTFQEPENNFITKVDKVELSFTNDETNNILNKLNSLTPKEFTSYKISAARASKIIAWREHNGPFTDLKSIRDIDGFGVKVVNKFCENLLKEPTLKKVKTNSRLRASSFLTPNLNDEVKQNIRSSVAIRISVSSLSWSRLELPTTLNSSPCLLTDWQHYEIPEKKLHLSELVQSCLGAMELIPEADCYIFENPQTAQPTTNPGNAEQQNINVQKAQIIAMLSYALRSRGSHSEVLSNETKIVSNGKVYFLRRFLAARIFNHLVGTERVSTEETLLKLMRINYNIKNSLYTDENSTATDSETLENLNGASISRNVQFPQNLREMFSEAERYRREFLGQALLMNLAFVRLVLLEDPETVDIIMRNQKKK
ncbi:uncharacterized protein LOC119668732 [Teleopsis dalmanni]|uniref:uncharacterized protein LOC119668732 n=1 Tax=Teleopsis dalmanni TaxID=139649 RepID=UPI000D32ADAF|nr:uncharacterized protein LOC119668732 [Teleopsis dalmanni]